MSTADAITLAVEIALAVGAAVYVAIALLRGGGGVEPSDDERIDSIRAELDVQEQRTRKVRAVR